MRLRGLILAVQFLTRLPTPQLRDFREEELSRTAVWFPLVGAIIGALLLLPLAVFDARPWLAALLALLLWVWVTGALHLDGLGDVADALGAAHRQPERFLEVLKDPHMGVFGTVTVALQLIAKLVLLAELARSPWWFGLLLVPAWARWATTLLWSRFLPPLHPGMAERFGWHRSRGAVWDLIWGVVLIGASAWLAPSLLVALLLAPCVAWFWKRKLGGISGDCLGASTEVLESLLLLALVVAPAGLRLF